MKLFYALAALLAPAAVAGLDTLSVLPHFQTAAASELQLDDPTTHYASPSDGCMADETPFQITGVPGGLCAPKCAFGQCPGDVPDGTTAKPQCVLSNPATGDKYCALICTPSAGLRATASDGDCGPATCQPVQDGIGICTYDVSQE
jgi:hypothetical protein